MKRFISLVVALMVVLSFSIVAAEQRATPHYDVVGIGTPITVDGVLNDAAWDEVGSIDGSFHFPWESVKAPRTIFKACQDGKNFYFSFVVFDKEILAEKTWKNESTVDVEDRVELFFAPAAVDKARNYALPTYYAIEVDPMGRVHDYSTVYYRHLEHSWNMEGLKTAAKIEHSKYVVEGSIPMATLKKLNLIDKNGVMRTGVYRAEFSRKGSEIDMRWISWVDPKTPEPDYHVDSSFGEFRFVK